MNRKEAKEKGREYIHCEIPPDLKRQMKVHLVHTEETMAAFVEAAITEKLERAQSAEETK